MKLFLATLLLLASCGSFAGSAAPGLEIVQSCIDGRATSSRVSVIEIPTQEINVMANYKDGYDATFFEFRGKDIGYAQKGNARGIVYGAHIYPQATARVIGRMPPTDLSPTLAQWLLLSSGEAEYLCISDNFEGIGRSGSFQKQRFGYLLRTNTAPKQRMLFFVSGPTAADASRPADRNASGAAR